MLSLPMLLHTLREYIIDQEIHFTRQERMLQSYVLDGQPISDEKLLYCGTPDAFIQAADHAAPGRYTFILAGTSPALGPYRAREDLNLIVTCLALPALCNLIYGAGASYDRWLSGMNRHLYVKPNLPKLIRCGGEWLGAGAYLLDGGYKVLCAAPIRLPRHPCLSDLDEREYLSYESIQTLHTLIPEGAEDRWARLAAEDGACMVSLLPIQHKSAVVAHLLLALPEERFHPALREMAGQFHTYAERFMLKYNREKYEAGSALSTLVGDLIESRLGESEELISRLKQLPVQVKKYYHCIVVELSGYLDAALMGRVLQELEDIFPQDVITPYKGDIVILAWKLRHYSEPGFDRARFSALLENYDAYACIGNFTRWLNSLRPIYLQTKGTIQYAKVFCPDPNNRLFRFEEYSMYHTVGLLADYCREFHRGDIVYLSHPGMITLANYDAKNGTNLCEVLHCYLKNDRNLSQTAKELFFHRNTLQNKIAKIEQIVGENLDDPMLRQRLLFSYRVLEYLQKYLKREDVYGRRRYSPSTAELIVDGDAPPK